MVDRSQNVVYTSHMGVNKHEVEKRVGLPELPAGAIGKELQRRKPRGKVTPDTVQRFLEAYRECGIISRAALAAGLSYSSINNLKRQDPEFEELMTEAYELYVAEKVDAKIYEMGFEGVNKPILGGPDKDQIVAYERVIHPQLTLAYAKKVDPRYREKQEVDVNHSGGVMVVPQRASNYDEWRKVVDNNAKDAIDAPTDNPEPRGEAE